MLNCGFFVTIELLHSFDITNVCDNIVNFAVNLRGRVFLLKYKYLETSNLSTGSLFRLVTTI